MTQLYPKIYTKLDWISLVYRNMTPFEVFESLGLASRIDKSVIDAFENRYLSSGYEIDLRIATPFGNLEVHYKDLLEGLQLGSYREAQYSKFFFCNFPYIRFDISGSALDAFRDASINVDEMFFVPLKLPNREDVGVEFTRADFAFDLVNYAPEFMIKLEELIKDVGNPDTFRVPTGIPSGMKYNIHKGAQGFTIYLGSTNSSKLLRIYDKKQQFRNSVSSIPYYEDQPEGRVYPFSWIRMELQTRREVTKSMMETSGGDFMQIFRYIYDKFAIMASKGSKTVSVLWSNLFNFNTIRSIIQNANSVVVISNYDRAEKYVENVCFRSILILLANDGWEKFKERIDNKLLFYQTEPDMKLRWQFYYSSLVMDDFKMPQHLKINENGIIQIE